MHQSRKRSATAVQEEQKAQRLLGQALASQPAPAPQRLPLREAEEAEEDELLLEALPSDLVAAARFLRSQAHLFHMSQGLPPVFLRTQLTSVLEATTGFERELDQLRRDNIVRVFKINTGPGEQALMMTNDYIDVLREAAARQTGPTNSPGGSVPSIPGHSAGHAAGVGSAAASTSAAAGAAMGASSGSAGVGRSSGAGSGMQQAIEAFCSCVVPEHTDLSISRVQLLHLLAMHGSRDSSLGSARAHVASKGSSNSSPLSSQQPRQVATCAPDLPSAVVCNGTKAAPLGFESATDAPQLTGPASLDAQVSHLMQVGALSRDPLDEGTYWLCVPGLGKVVQAISAGRRELSTLLARRKYREVPEKQLLSKTKLRRSPLGVNFHLRDMLGLGLLERVTTTSGPIIRLSAH